MPTYRSGAYLMRTSTSHPGDFVISLCHNQVPHHFHVKTYAASQGFGLEGAQRFATLPDFVAFHQSTTDRLPVLLSVEIPRT
eukprot:m.158382 g.158382  ORF g.158382 m.158382 type:complete len:82 (+) comp16468_c0_seq1:2351-2596(+)